MTEYLIQEESLVELADIVRDKFKYYNASIGLVSNRSSLTSIPIPDGITEIEFSVFKGCSGLTSITIPDSVTEISSSAFDDCTALTDIYLNPINPPVLSGGIKGNFTIHVPIGSGDAYKSATNWSPYASRIVEDIEIE